MSYRCPRCQTWMKHVATMGMVLHYLCPRCGWSKQTNKQAHTEHVVQNAGVGRMLRRIFGG
ncbi:MAG: hypothetical protein ABIH46_07020 [Chloroflexota bacterium]